MSRNIFVERCSAVVLLLLLNTRLLPSTSTAQLDEPRAACFLYRSFGSCWLHRMNVLLYFVLMEVSMLVWMDAKQSRAQIRGSCATRAYSFSVCNFEDQITLLIRGAIHLFFLQTYNTDRATGGSILADDSSPRENRLGGLASFPDAL